MTRPDQRDVAQQIDRIRMLGVRASAGMRSALIASGWVAGDPDATDTDYPSFCQNRVNWLAPTAPIDDHAVAEAIAAAKSLGLSRYYFWIAPWALNAPAIAALTRAGATEWPHVKYPVLLRASTPPPAPPSTTLHVRAVTPQELPNLLDTIAPWFSATGVARARRAVDLRGGEPFAAFDQTRPVAFAIIFPDPEFAYFGFAGTDPEYRKRGAQSALIHARVARAAALGRPWCLAETNTVAESSLGNLTRLGFEVVFEWRVFGWAPR